MRLPVPMAPSPEASKVLDATRFLSAICVVLWHLQIIFFPEPTPAALARPVSGMLYFLSGVGHQAVMIFLVLSGFFIGGSVGRSIETDRWSWRSYLLHRGARLYIVLIPSLLLGLFWDRLGLHLFSSAPIYSGHERGLLMSYTVHDRLAGWILLGNALFLQGLLTPTFGSNAPLWSLSIEAWCYLIFPLLLVAWRCPVSTRARLIHVALAVLMLVAGRGKVWPLFLIWSGGAIVAFAPRARLPRFVLPLALALLVGDLYAAHRNLAYLGNDFAVGIASAIFLFAALNHPYRTRRRIPWAALAGFSYSLYVIHYPILIFVRAWIAPRAVWPADAAHLALGAGLLAITLAYARLFARLTEAKTPRLRAWLERRAGSAEEPPGDLVPTRRVAAK